MTNFNSDSAYVWIWLADAQKPIVAGKLEKKDFHHDFFYGQSYLNNSQAISLSETELPLVGGRRFTSIKEIHYVIRDALPDAWGRRILNYRYQTSELSILDMLLLSSSDRIGALHFQETADTYSPRFEDHATLEQLLEATSLIEKGEYIPKELEFALNHGTSVGGARPKALINHDDKKYIAKFSSLTDIFPLVQAEYAAMWLAQKIGINAAPVKLVEVKGRFVLLIERFDRIKIANYWARKFMVSALTLLQLDEMEGRYASYLDLADQITRNCKMLITDLHELFKRMVFNILIGNTDDHAKNHSFFWDGKQYELTPAYDICPYPRAGQEATQAMIVGKYGALSQLRNALTAAPWFHLSEESATQIIDELVAKVREFWPEACKQARLKPAQCDQLTGTAVLNPYCF